MAKKCKDCDPNKYIEGLAYRGRNGHSFDGYYQYNDVGQPYDNNGNPKTDMLADVNDMLDAYNPIFSTNSTVGLPPSTNNRLSIRGIDAKLGFWFIWSFTDGLISFANPGVRANPAAITSGRTAKASKGNPFFFRVSTDQVPSSLSYTGFERFADKNTNDFLRFSEYLENQNYTQINQEVTITTDTTIFRLNDSVFCQFKSGAQTKNATYRIIEVTPTTIKIRITPDNLTTSGLVDLYALSIFVPSSLNNDLIKSKSNYVGYDTGYIVSTINYGNTTSTSKKSLTVRSFSSDITNSVYFTESAPSYLKLAMPLTVREDKTDASPSITSGSSTEKIVSNNEVFFLSSAPYNGYSGAAYFNGAGFLTIQPSTDFAFSSGNFTIEWSQYWNTLSGTQTIFGEGTTTPGILIQTSSSGKYRIYLNGNTILTETTSALAGQWYHYALVRNGTNVTLYRDGVANGSATISAGTTVGNGTSTMYIGRAPNDARYYLNGYVQSLRVYKGYAKYTSTFSPSPGIILTEGNTGEPIYVNSAPTIAALRNESFYYNLTTNLPANKFTANLEARYIDVINNLGLAWNPTTKVIQGTVSSNVSETEVKTATITFNVRADVDADSGNSTTFTLNIVYGKKDTSLNMPVMDSGQSSSWTVGTNSSATISQRYGKIISVSNLPQGLSFNSSNNRIEGTPVHAGLFVAYASCSNMKGDSSLEEYILNVQAFEDNNRAGSSITPSEIKILQNSYNILKNNKITMKITPPGVRTSTSGLFYSITYTDFANLDFKKINKNEYQTIKDNGKPSAFTGTYTRDTTGLVSITISSATTHGFKDNPTINGIYITTTVNSGGLASQTRKYAKVTGVNTLTYQEDPTGRAFTNLSGNITLESYQSLDGNGIIEEFRPGLDPNGETSFWIKIQDNDKTLGQSTLNLEGTYSIDYSEPSIIDALGNTCFAPTTDSNGPVSTPSSVSLDVNASSLIKNSISANPAENIPTINFSPGPNIEHQVIFSSPVLRSGSIISATSNTITVADAGTNNQWQGLSLTVTDLAGTTQTKTIASNTTTSFTLSSNFDEVPVAGHTFEVSYPLETSSTIAQQRLSKTNLLKYPYGIPVANGTYYFYVNFTDVCAFNKTYNPFTFYVGTYTPRAGDVYSCYYWYTPSPPRSYKSRCFPKGTKIYTPNGNIDIKDIKVGEYVYAFDEQRNIIEAKVTAFLDHDLVPDKIYRITLEDGQYIRANEEHPFLIGDNIFLAVKDLKVNDEIFTFHDKKLKIIEIKEDGFEPVYNIEVEKYHTYIAENLFVHNRAVYTRPRQVKAYRNVAITDGSVPSSCDGGIVSRIGDNQTYKDYGFQYRNTLLESKDIGITSLTNISILDVLGEGPIEGIVDYEIKPKPGYKKGDVGYVNGVDLIPYPGQNSFIRSIYWQETALADDTYPNPGSVNFEFIKLKFDNGDSSPRHANLQLLSEIQMEEEFYSKRTMNGTYINSLRFIDQNDNVIGDNIKLPKRLTSTKTVGTKLNGKRVFQDGTEKTYKKSINVLTKDLYAIKLHIKAISLFKQIVDLRIFDSATEAEENSEGGRVDRQSMTFNLTLKRIDKGSNGEGLDITPLEIGTGGKTSIPLVITGRLNAGAFIETFEWSGLDKVSNKNTIGWEIEIEPTYIEPIDGNIVLKSGIDSITEVYNEFLSLPHTAAILTTFDARFFTSIPQRAYDVRMLKVKIPSNYNPWSKTYDGVWDGRFKLAWTDNPAWCFYDILTNRRYGLGKYVDPQFTDKWTLYEIGKYCDELVNDGKGGLEPRFTCNVLISTREDAYKVVNDMASIFRAIVYYNAGLIMTSQDKPKEAIYLFNNSNVKDGEFTYSNTSKRVRRNVALVRYNDKENFFKPAVKYVESREGLIRYGIRETEVSAFGCTSEGQAERLGKWTLLSENFESELISFETTLPGMYLKPGDVILIQDANRQNKILGGRTYELKKDTAILDIKYEDIAGYLPVISGCKFNILTPAGNIDLANESGQFINQTGFINTEFQSYGGTTFSGISPALIRRKQVQTINFNVNTGEAVNPFSSYVSLETGYNYEGYTRISFGGQLLDDKDHTLLNNTVWTIEIEPTKYNYQISPSVSSKNSISNYPGASLEPYIDKTQKFRILDIEEQEEFRYKVTALQYDESKYEIGDDV